MVGIPRRHASSPGTVGAPPSSPTPMSKTSRSNIGARQSFDSRDHPQDDGEVAPDDGNPDPGDTTSDSAGTAEELIGFNLGLQVRDRMQWIKSLHDLGVESSDIDLPKICVVGDQSAGKSSLIEGLSRIKVPRSAGTCTRCPLEISLSEANDDNAPAWICKVSIIKKYAFNSQFHSRSGGRVGTSNHRYGPWIEQQAQKIDFATTQHRSEVTEIIRRAQAAVLNPRIVETHFLSTQLGSYGHAGSNEISQMQEKFSPNIVSVEIVGTGLPELFFFDLPGVINVAETDGEKYLVQLIENLNHDYISRSNCIVLLTLPMTDDPVNSSASRLVRKLRAESRTVGVFTKPDRLQKEESITQWKSIFHGEKFVLGHEYYAVMNDSDPAVSHEVARQREAYYFRTESPWNTDFKPFVSRFGTKNLQDYLCRLLGKQVVECAPGISEQIERRLLNVETELSRLPEPPKGNIPMLVNSRITDICRVLQENIDGGNLTAPFQMQWRDKTQELRATLIKTEPKLKLPNLGSRPLATPPSQVASSIEDRTPQTQLNQLHGGAGEDELEIVDIRPCESGTKRRAQDTLNSQSTPRRRVNKSGRRHSRGGAETPQTSVSQNLDGFKTSVVLLGHEEQLGTKFSFEDITERIKRGYSNLPGSIDPRVIERMSQDSINHWRVVVGRYMTAVQELSEDLVSKTLQGHLGSWRETALWDKTLDCARMFLTDAFSTQRTKAEELVKMEQLYPITFAGESLYAEYNKALPMLRDRWLTRLAEIEVAKQEGTGGRALDDKERQTRIVKCTNDPSFALIDPKDQELDTMARVRAYYHCALSRFVDTLAMHIKGGLFTEVRDDICNHLLETLGVRRPDANEYCKSLVDIDDGTRSLRGVLEKQVESLKEAKNKWSAMREEVSFVKNEDDVAGIDDGDIQMSGIDEI